MFWVGDTIPWYKFKTHKKYEVQSLPPTVCAQRPLHVILESCACVPYTAIGIKQIVFSFLKYKFIIYYTDKILNLAFLHLFSVENLPYFINSKCTWVSCPPFNNSGIRMHLIINGILDFIKYNKYIESLIHFNDWVVDSLCGCTFSLDGHLNCFLPFALNKQQLTT